MDLRPYTTSSPDNGSCYNYSPNRHIVQRTLHAFRDINQPLLIRLRNEVAGKEITGESHFLILLRGVGSSHSDVETVFLVVL